MTARAQPVSLPASAATSGVHVDAGLAHRGKAWLARRLMAIAWNRSLRARVGMRPWPWAATHPVAKLDAPRQGAALLVMAGASGRTLALGPGHVDGTPLPGNPGNAVIRGHCDTHFSFLRDVRSGDALVVQRMDGDTVRYLVAGVEVVRRNDVRVLLDAGDDRLTMITPYPFSNPMRIGALRYVVVATRVGK